MSRRYPIPSRSVANLSQCPGLRFGEYAVRVRQEVFLAVKADFGTTLLIWVCLGHVSDIEYFGECSECYCRDARRSGQVSVLEETSERLLEGHGSCLQLAQLSIEFKAH